SCLMLAVQVDGAEIQTVEGLAWGQLQEAFRANHALQCGFCTPGILLAASALLERGAPPTREEIVDMLSGHLCRCTGYEPIVEAIAQAAEARGTSRCRCSPPPSGTPAQKRSPASRTRSCGNGQRGSPAVSGSS